MRYKARVSLFPIPPFVHRTLVEIAEYNQFVTLTELAAVGMLRRGLLRKEGSVFVLTPSADAYITMYRKQKHNNAMNRYRKEGIEWETQSHSVSQ